MNGSSKFSCIDGFGEELDEIIYEGVSNWFISFRSLFTVYSAHFSYLVVFFSIISCGLLSYRHSVENGKKYTQFWWGAFIHGVLSETGWAPTKYWHAQAPVMFMGKQLPLHVTFLYPSILYVAMMAAQRLNLNVCTEPAAVGLVAMLMELPYRMISVKFLHITYHDTEPTYFFKVCGVPWIEVFSSLVFSSSYVAVYHGIKYYQSRDVSSIWDKSTPTGKEIMTTIISGLSSPLFGFVQKIFLFHFFHDIFNVNPVSCLLFVLSLYLSFVVCFEPKKIPKCIVEDSCSKVFLFYQILIYLSCLLYLALFGKPQNEVSIGTHEPVGDCTMLVCSRSPLGKPLKRKKYLCADEVAARKCFVYNFDCLEEGPPCLHAIWYTICGSTIYNKPQFFLNVLSFVLLLCTVFFKPLINDVIQLDAAKRLIVSFGNECQEPGSQERNSAVQRAQSPENLAEEVTVGYSVSNKDIQSIPSNITSGLALSNKDIQSIPSHVRSGIAFSNKDIQSIPSHVRSAFASSNKDIRSIPSNVRSGLVFSNRDIHQVPSNVTGGLALSNRDIHQVPSNVRSGLALSNRDIHQVPSNVTGGLALSNRDIHQVPSNVTGGLALSNRDIHQVPSNVRSGLALSNRDIHQVPSNVTGGLALSNRDIHQVPSNVRSGLALSNRDIHQVPSNVTSGLALSNKDIHQAPNNDTSSDTEIN